MEFVPKNSELITKINEILMNQSDQLTQTEKFFKFEHMLQRFTRSSQKATSNYRNPIFDLILFFVYPRLDINVTRKTNHLLKSPFVIHPGTGYVCVPIIVHDSKIAKSEHEENLNEYEKMWAVDHFDPFSHPTLDQICKQYYKSSNSEELKQNLLKPYIDYFLNSFVIPIENSIIMKKRKKE